MDKFTNLKFLKDLAKLMKETNLTEVELVKDDTSIRLSQQSGQNNTQPIISLNSMPSPQGVQPSQVATPIDHRETTSNTLPLGDIVKAPLVGTVYLSPTPSKPAFIKEGAKVNEGDTLLIIESMKVMNHIKAPKSGTIAKIIVKNEEPVEFDQHLIIIS